MVGDQNRDSGELQMIQANYKLEGRRVFQGLPISIENDTGSTREGVDAKTGKPWKTVMKYPYGYIRMTEGVDGDHVDCFIGPNENAKMAYVIHQVDPDTKKFDEDKVMLGFNSADAAKEAYLQHYDSPDFFGSMSVIPMDKFKEKVLATRNNPKKIAAQYRMEAAMALYAQGRPVTGPGG